MEGLAQAAWGVEVRRLDLGIGDFPVPWIADNLKLFISALDITAGVVAAIMIIGLFLLFKYTKIGLGLRAVADDAGAASSIGIPLKHIMLLVWSAAGVVAAIMIIGLFLLFKYTKIGLGLRAVADDAGAASSIGIPLKHIMLLVWSAAGVVALVAGCMWGARAGVQFALVDLALKALPVLIIGGFSSIPGAIIGGLIIGAVEKVLEVYIGPFFGGAIEGWAPYVLAIFFLLYRPEGLFGEKIIRRV